MKFARSFPKIAILALVVLPGAQACPAADPAPSTSPVSRDWRLSELRTAIKGSGKNLPDLVTGISIVDDDTLQVYVTNTRQPLSGVGAEVTLKFSEKSGWEVSKVTFLDR